MAHLKKEAFLAAFAEMGVVRYAADKANVARRTVYDWLERDAEFRARFAEAEQQALDMLEVEAVRRARVGVDEPVYQGGRQVGSVRKYSDTLLIFLLKGGRPSKYRERVDVSLDVRGVIERLTDDPGEREAALAEAQRILSERR
jgi:hypothetical protein